MTDLTVQQPDYLSEAWRQNAVQPAPQVQVDSVFNHDVFNNAASPLNPQVAMNDPSFLNEVEDASIQVRGAEMKAGGSVLTGLIDAGTDLGIEVKGAIAQLNPVPSAPQPIPEPVVQNNYTQDYSMNV